MKRIFAAVATLMLAGVVGCSSGSNGGTGTSGSTGVTGGTTGTTLPTTSTGSTGSTGCSGTTGQTTASCPTQLPAQGPSTPQTSGATPGYEAAHSAFPTVPNNTNGPTLHHVQIITSTFDGYQYQSDIEAFDSWLVSSHWLADIGADYDVHNGTNVTQVRFAEAAPASTTDQEIQDFITAKINDGTFPAPGATLSCTGDTLTEPLYTVFYPGSTTILLPEGGGQNAKSCRDFGGYHSWFAYFPPGASDAVAISYAVLPTCQGFAGGNFSTIEGVEVAMSHEVAEAVTDPFPTMDFANPTSSYSIEDYTQSPWAFIPGEVGDICVQQDILVADGSNNYGVQRIWSNSAAASGGSPCIPWDASKAYFNVAPDLTTTQHVAPNTTVTYQLTAFSDRNFGTDGSWYVFVTPYQGNYTPNFSLDTDDGQHLDQGSGWNAAVNMHNGQHATLTVSSGTQANEAAALLIGSSLTGSDFNFWPIAVWTQ